MVRNAAPSASTSGPNARGGGMPYGDPRGGAGAGRGGFNGAAGATRPFKDKSGNVTERSRDTGWGARAGPPPPPPSRNDAHQPIHQGSAPRGDARGYQREDRYDSYGQGAYGGYDRYEGGSGDGYRVDPRTAARYNDAPRRRSPTPQYPRRGAGRDEPAPPRRRSRRDSYSRSPSRSRSPPPARSPAHSPPPAHRRPYEDYDDRQGEGEEPPKKLARKGQASARETDERKDDRDAGRGRRSPSTPPRRRRDSPSSSRSRSRSRSRSGTHNLKRPSQGRKEQRRDERDVTPEMRRRGQASRSLTPEMARPSSSRPARAPEEPQREKEPAEDLEAREQRLKGRLAKSRWAE